MRLFYFNTLPNFGDMLNPWIWDRLLPDTFSSSASDDVIFTGIGTILNSWLPQARKTVVFSSGAGYCQPVLPDSTWNVLCVRGPITAAALRLSPDLAVADGALLLRRLYRPSGKKRFKASFIPHHDRMREAAAVCRRLCAVLGLHLVDVRDPVDSVLAQIAESELVIAEAMHGAIVADAFRVPWVAVRTYAAPLTSKWCDWTLSMDLEYSPHYLGVIHDYDATVVGRSKRLARYCISIPRLYHVLSKAPPQLSRDAMLESRTSQLEEKVEEFKRKRALGEFQ